MAKLSGINGNDFEEQIALQMTTLGWNCHRDRRNTKTPSPKNPGRFIFPDILAEKDGISLIIECKRIGRIGDMWKKIFFDIWKYGSLPVAVILDLNHQRSDKQHIVADITAAMAGTNLRLVLAENLLEFIASCK